MRAILRWTAIAACAIALAGSSGCGSPNTRFYSLHVLAPGPGHMDAVAARGPALGVGPVYLPERLNRPEIVTWSNENLVHLAAFDRWAAPLQDSVPRVLAENLSILVPTDRVTVLPWTSENQIDYEVRVDVSRFEGSLGKDCSLVARWSIVRRADKQTMTGRSNHTEQAGESYAALVAAHNRLLTALSRDIATALQALAR